jgi:hypothetical protein
MMKMKAAPQWHPARYVNSMYMVSECVSAEMSNIFCLRFVINTEQKGKEE